MKFNLSLWGCFLLLAPLIAHADVVLVTGTPGDSLLAAPTGPSPNLHQTLLTFSTLTPFSTFTPSTYAAEGVTISSPDGLIVEPYSTQSVPNYLFDNSSDGTADITISLSQAAIAIGVGIADSDSPANIQLQPLGAGDTDLGSPFAVTIPETTINPGNGYFVVEDTAATLFGLQITETDSGSNYSGLAIADVQTAVPEPSSLWLLAGAIGILGFCRLRKTV
jgi:PEP-CTERM motif